MRSPAAARLLAVVAAGVSMGCAKGPEAPPPLPRTGDYEVYSAVLREHFIVPRVDDHADGPESPCPADQLLDTVRIVRETRLRRQGGGSRDSALAAELPAETAPLVTALRGLDRLPPLALEADSFALGVPVLLVDSAGPRHRDEWGPITLSRVVYNADSTRAIVHAVEPCLAELSADDEERGDQGTAVLVALDRRQGVWKTAELVWLYVE